MNPFRGLSGTTGTINELEASALPQPPVAKMVNGAREAALGTALRDGSDPTATLEEYAWRSLIARVRVRDYCEGATFAVCAVSDCSPTPRSVDVHVSFSLTTTLVRGMYHVCRDISSINKTHAHLS